MSGVIKRGEDKKFKLWQPEAPADALAEEQGVEFAGSLRKLQAPAPTPRQSLQAKAYQHSTAKPQPRHQVQPVANAQAEKPARKGVWEMFDSASDAVMEFLFPSHCPLCGAYVERRGAWCVPCLQRTLHVRRLTIATELRPLISEAWGMGYYHGVLGNLIRKLKYEKDLSAQPSLSAILSGAALPETFAAKLKDANLLAVPVPLFQAKEKERGFNQTELVFQPWLEETGLSWGRAVLRVRDTMPQFGLDVVARRRNLRKAFAVPEEWRQVLRGRTVLLLDDIMTSGSTLAECAAAVRAAGAVDVMALVLASGRRPEAKRELHFRRSFL